MKLGLAVGGLGLALMFLGGASGAEARSLNGSSLSSMLLSRQLVTSAPTAIRVSTTSSTRSAAKSSQVQAVSANGPNISTGDIRGSFQSIVARLRNTTYHDLCNKGVSAYCPSPN